MEWTDLSPSAANVIERCWSIFHDNPLSFKVNVGSHVHGKLVTEETYSEILKYQKSFPYFNVRRDEDIIIVNGNCEYGNWFK